jgi:uncharacterized OB-fold protein
LIAKRSGKREKDKRSMKAQVPFMDGIFTGKNSELYLLATKCKSCGQIYFPMRASCVNCFSQGCEEVPLSKRGKLYSFTISYMPVYNFNPPHTMGYIELPEGIMIFAPLTDFEEKRLKVGMEMEMIIDILWETDQNQIVGYKFRPI